MNTTKEIFHAALLKIMDANRTRFGLQAPVLALHLRALAVGATPDEIVQALEYFGSRPAPLVEETRPEIDRENRAWKITAEGIRYVDQHGL